MKTIWKFPLRITSTQDIEMPFVRNTLCVQMQNDSLFVWAEVDPNSPKETVRFQVFGTGHPMPNPDVFLKYIGTVYPDIFVWHVYEEQPQKSA